MVNSCLFLIACLLPFQQEQVESANDRLAPATLKKPLSFKVEAPRFLTEKDIVEAPEQVLELLKNQQQKAFEELKTIKGSAWHSFIKKKDNESTLSLLEFSRSENPMQVRELCYCSKKAFDDFKAGKKVETEGLSSENKAAFYCFSGKISTSEMLVRAMFLTYVSEGPTEMITVHKPDPSNNETILGYSRMHFGFDVPPADFYDHKLPKMLKGRYTLVVKRKGELVELEFLHSSVKGRPAEVLLFDLSKSGKAVCRYDMGWKTESEFEKVGNIWLPKLVKKVNPNQYSETRFFDWKVNGDFADHEFSIKSLPANEKTQVHDRRTGKNTRFKDLKE